MNHIAIYWGIFSIVLGIAFLLLVINFVFGKNSDSLVISAVIFFMASGIMLFLAILITPESLKKRIYYKPDEIIRSKHLIHVINDSLGSYESNLKITYDLSDSLICILEIKKTNFYGVGVENNKYITECEE